ncbi:hypothetical protein Tco_0920266 [Tanacetum coccineum]
MQSSFVSSNFANQFLNLDNVPPTDTKVVSIMNVNVHHEEPSTQTPPFLNIPITLDKDLFESYGKVYSLKRDREDKDKDEDPPAGSDQGLKKQKMSKDAEPSRGSKSKESKSRSSKGSKSQSKSSGKSSQAEEPAASKDDGFKKPERPPTPDSGYNSTKSIDFKPIQTWISKIAKAGKPPLTFDEQMSTPIDFSAYVMNNLKIKNLT